MWPVLLSPGTVVPLSVLWKVAFSVLVKVGEEGVVLPLCVTLVVVETVVTTGVLG